MSAKQISSIEDLIQVLENDFSDYRGNVWYRGQENEKWGLIPGYFRSETATSESTLVKRFKQSAAMLINTAPKASFDWLFLMQHYGVPTRLLDWSENPLVGLYFAIGSTPLQMNQDAALWALKPSELNKNAGIDSEEAFFIPSFDDEELENYSVEILSQNTRNKLKPLATIATRNNSRIQAQHGVFTIHHNDRIAIESVGDSGHITKYIVPAASKEKILKQLKLLGFTKFQLFPELASIGEIIKEGLL